MNDRATTMTIEQRVATALEGIEVVLNEVLALLPPPRNTLPRDHTPQPRATPREDVPPTDAHHVYLSGQWKRRDGHGVQAAPGPMQRGLGSPPIGTQLDPWVKRDVPMIDGEDDRAEPPITVHS